MEKMANRAASEATSSAQSKADRRGDSATSVRIDMIQCPSTKYALRRELPRQSHVGRMFRVYGDYLYQP